MTGRDRFWTGRRVFVLGCTGFLGGWAVRGLLARGADVVGLVRDPNPASGFFRDKLYRQVHVARGRADDVSRLRTLFAVYEPQFILQCAADPEGVADAFNSATTAAAGSIPVVIPVHPRRGRSPAGRSEPRAIRLPRPGSLAIRRRGPAVGPLAYQYVPVGRPRGVTASAASRTDRRTSPSRPGRHRSVTGHDHTD